MGGGSAVLWGGRRQRSLVGESASDNNEMLMARVGGQLNSHQICKNVLEKIEERQKQVRESFFLLFFSLGFERPDPIS